jgi:hypothetical protein
MTELHQSAKNPKSAANSPRQKVCEKCGATFDCHAPWGPCWCDEVKLKTETLASLRAKFKDCLCPTCLKAAAAAQSAKA